MARPTFADPRNPFVFHRIFGSPRRTDVLVAFLHDLLELDEAHRIASVEQLSSKQRPPVTELQLSIVNVRCTDVRGASYVVAMQVLQVEGFDRHLASDVLDTYALQPACEARYPGSGDVIGITICDFALWPDTDERRLPMLTRWRTLDRPPSASALSQLQLVFLELPKYDASRPPRTSIEKWAYFLRETDNLSAVPEVLAEPSFLDAFEAARIARFTVDEWNAYIDAGIAIQSQRGALAIAEQRGRRRGYEVGRKEALLQGLEAICSALGIALTEARRRELANLDTAGLMTFLACLQEGQSGS